MPGPLLTEPSRFSPPGSSTQRLSTEDLNVLAHAIAGGVERSFAGQMEQQDMATLGQIQAAGAVPPMQTLLGLKRQMERALIAQPR